jgi:hypothetical protein
MLAADKLLMRKQALITLSTRYTPSEQNAEHQHCTRRVNISFEYVANFKYFKMVIHQNCMHEKLRAG